MAEGKNVNGKKEKKKRPEGILVIKGDEKKADRAMEEGGIETNLFIESHGNDRETVADALKSTLLKDLRAEEGVTVRKISFHPVVEKEKIYSGFVECNLVSRDPQVVLYLSLRYGPSAVEVVKPDEIKITNSELQNMAADASAAVQALTGRILEMMTPEERTKALKQGLELE